MDKQTILKNLLQIALMGILLALLLLILKLVGNRFATHETFILQWFLFNTLPFLLCLAVLFFGATKQTSYYVSANQYNIQRYLLWGYLGLLLLSLLLPSNINGDIPEYARCTDCEQLRISYYWLLPFQIILLLALSAPILRKKESAQVLFNNTLILEMPDIAVPASLRKSKINVFLSYNEADSALMTALDKHLAVFKRNEIVATWNDQKVLASAKWEETIATQLAKADLILLLISSDFIADECSYNKQLEPALKLQQAGKAVVIPILLRPCLWEEDPKIAQLSVLPDNKEPVTSWEDQDKAFVKIVSGIKAVLKIIYAKG